MFRLIVSDTFDTIRCASGSPTNQATEALRAWYSLVMFMESASPTSVAF